VTDGGDLGVRRAQARQALARAGVQPRPRALLDHLRARLTPAIIDQLAGADYGADEDQHRAALAAIAAGGDVPVPLDWHPREVLALATWWEPDDATTPPPLAPEVRHLGRAFAAAVLLQYNGLPGHEQIEGENQTAAALVDSARALGPAAAAAAADLLAWRLEATEVDGAERPFLALGLLILLIPSIPARATPAPLSPADWTTLVGWLLAEEASSGPPARPWLHHPRYNRRDDLWRRLARAAFTGPTAPPGSEALGEKIGGWVT
jgi:hypothetical protein